MNNFHTPVLLKEVVEGLRVKKDGKYIDGTIGGGGHTEEILKSGGRVLGIDQDREAIKHLKKKFESEINTGRLILEHANFSDIEEIAKAHDFTDVDGILLDLGVSSYQIDDSGRGFSFIREEELDMRMNQDGNLTAFEIINSWSEDELREIFARYGEEMKAKEVAHAIVQERDKSEINTSRKLATIIESVIKPNGKINPSTRIFQAIRIAVNDEINSLKKGIGGGFKLLNEGGRFEIISFHSLEDRIVKLSFLEFARSGGEIITKKPLVANFEEERRNRRSRSAKLRIIEKK